jgi:hypothetical protein
MVPSGADRARWLAELAQAVEEAQHLVWQMGSAVGGSSAMLDLSARLEVVRHELESIRRGRRRVEEAPEWTEFRRSALFEPAGGTG